MSITGEPGGPPTKTGLSVVDFSSGLAAALATMVAIHAARRDGVGCDCDVSLLETALSMLSYIGSWTATAGFLPERVAQSGHPTLVPFGNFPTADGWLVAGGSKEKFWTRLAIAVERADLVDDPRFRTFADRLRNREELLVLINDAFRRRTTAEWLKVLAAAGVPCAPVNTVTEALADEQVAARGALERVEHSHFGSVAHLRSPVRVGDERLPVTNAPGLGEHTGLVLRDVLGYPEAKVGELAKLGVVSGPGV
jgi:crotonobetainyl-CoA:carnitine CoA-transferase CaiB-like acyl-CoA transferase